MPESVTIRTVLRHLLSSAEVIAPNDPACATRSGASKSCKRSDQP
jgi:hypothetical protein